MRTSYDDYLFRSSSMGKLMSGASFGLTQRQEETLEGYKEMVIKHYNNQGKNLTPTQWKTFADLQAKANAKPELSKGAKSYLLKIWKEETFGMNKDLQSKYLDKGIQVEEQSITLVSEVFGKLFVKNNERRDNGFWTGECDNKQGKIRDLKNSWDYETFPLHEDKLPNADYDWQMQCYMDLWDIPQAEVIYTLVDTPDMLIDDEIKRFAYKAGLFDVPEEVEDEIRHNMTYSHIPKELRVKVFYLNRSRKKINLMKQYVKMARKFLNELNETVADQFDRMKEAA